MYSYSSTYLFHNLLQKLKERSEYEQCAIPPLNFRGTVKLHGSNCGVFLQDGQIYAQSRNRVLTAESDFNYFHDFVSKHEAYFKDLLAPYASEGKVPVVYGEWCRDNRRGMGITALGEMYVVFALRIADAEAISFEESDDTSDAVQLPKIYVKNYQLPISSASHKIYDIRDFPQFDFTLDVKDLETAQDRLTELTMMVEAECPVAKQLGSLGLGEGIVWECTTDHKVLRTLGMKFKTKGERHKVTNRRQLADTDVLRLNSTREFAEMVTTENRLLQAVDYLREFNMTVSMDHIGKFLAWVNKDVLKEEADTIKASGLERKEAISMVQDIAKKWYIAEVKKQVRSMKL